MPGLKSASSSRAETLASVPLAWQACDMRITVSMPSTGLVYAPGLARPVVIDTDELPPTVARKLERLADDAQLFEQTDTTFGTGSGKSRDAQETSITVEAEGKERTFRVTDPIGAIASKPLREFVMLVREEAERLRQKD